QVAFVHAFRHLLLGTGYLPAATETLKGGGDTDTNACIVGGLIGAACGVQGIPEHMRQAVLHCYITKGGQSSRPPRLQTLHSFRPLLASLLRLAPTSLATVKS